MKAVLVGAIHEDKLYYVIDAAPGEKDAILERPNGSIVKTTFIGITSKARGLKKFRNTRFHRLLWDKPQNVVDSSWYRTFVTKERDIPEKSLEEAVVVTSLGESRKKIKTKDARATAFLQELDNKARPTSICCGEMVKSFNSAYSFSTTKERKDAWTAMIIMRELEGN